VPEKDDLRNTYKYKVVREKKVINWKMGRGKLPRIPRKTSLEIDDGQGRVQRTAAGLFDTRICWKYKRTNNRAGAELQY
jgi:hypothetical protein